MLGDSGNGADNGSGKLTDAVFDVEKGADKLESLLALNVCLSVFDQGSEGAGKG